MNTPGIFTTEPWLTIITGHYGVGKTNLSLNIVRDMRKLIERVTLIDLDIVNPYFRSTDSIDFLDAHDIEVFGPVYARSTLDTPSLAPGIDEAIIAANPDRAVLIDVGGDPDGARALGRYAGKVASCAHRLVYVVNAHRPDMTTVDENMELLKAIEETSGLKVTHVVGNTHLKEFTTATDIVAAIELAREVARATGAELTAITAPRTLAPEVEELLRAGAPSPEESILVYPVDKIVSTPWE
jgi:hypothetical protein